MGGPARGWGGVDPLDLCYRNSFNEDVPGNYFTSIQAIYEVFLELISLLFAVLQ